MMKMLKEYLAENQISMYQLAAESHVPYSTVNDLVNRRIDVKNCRAGALKQLADAMSISMNQLYDLCCNEITIVSAAYGVEAMVRSKGKKYYVEFSDHGRPVMLEVCPVKEDTSYFIRSLAEWTVEDYFNEREWENANAVLAHA